MGKYLGNAEAEEIRFGMRRRDGQSPIHLLTCWGLSAVSSSWTSLKAIGAPAALVYVSNVITFVLTIRELRQRGYVSKVI